MIRNLERKNKNYFFDVSFFRYVLSTSIRKFSIHIVAITYLLLIVVVINIVPIIAINEQPIWILNNPIVISFFVFGNSTVSLFLVIEIFRTPIEDGTEILTMSKPLSRMEITIVKTSVFLLFVTLISLLASVAASFVYLNKESSSMDNMFIVIGMFVGTFISSIVYGAFAIILSIYCRKIIALLVVILVSFSLTLSNVFISMSSSNPLKILSKQDKNINYINLISNSNSVDSKMNIKYGVIPVSNNGNVVENEYGSTIYNEAKLVSNWHILSYFNLSNQLASMYILNSSPRYPYRYFQTSRTFSDSNYLEFYDYDLNNEIKYGFYFDLPNDIKDIFGIKENIFYSNFLLEMNTHYKFNLYSKNRSRYFKPINYDNVLNKDLDSRLFNETWDKYSSDIEENLKIAYEKYKLDNTTIIPNPLSILIEKMAIDFKLNEYNLNKFYNLLSEVFWSGIKNFMNLRNIDLFTIVDFFNVDESIPNIFPENESIKVRNIYPNYNKIPETIKNKINNYLGIEINDSTNLNVIQTAVKQKLELKNFLSTKLKNRSKNLAILKTVGYELVNEYDITNSEILYSSSWGEGELSKLSSSNIKDKIDFNYDSLVKLKELKLFDYFQEIKAKSLYDSKILFPIWISISLILFILSIALYSKKDYF